MTGFRRFLLVIFLFVLTLSPPRCVYWGVETYDCSLGLDDIDAVLAAATEKWPEAERIAARLDIMCEPPGVQGIANFNNCKQEVLACSWRLGSDSQRAGIMVVNDVPVDVLLGHEMLHLVAWERGFPDGCYDHTPDCWDWEAVEELQQLAMDPGDCVRGECVCVAEDGSKDFASECSFP